MQLNDDDIKQLEKLAPLNPVISKILDGYKKLVESPFLEGYLTYYRQINNWNKEIETESNKINLVQVMLTDEDGKMVGTIDKTFENTLKYLTAMPSLYEKMEVMRSKLSPQELSELKQHTSDIDKARNEIKDAIRAED